jgi:glutathione S-transferase
VRASPNLLDFDLDDWPTIRKWCDSTLARETVKKALKVPGSTMTEDQFAVIVAGKRKEMLERKNADLH